MSHTTARPRQADTSLDSQTMIGRQRESDPWRERWSSACRWAARPMMTTLACKAGVVVCCADRRRGFVRHFPNEGGRELEQLLDTGAPSGAGAVPSRRNWGHRHRFKPCDPVVGHGGAAEFRAANHRFLTSVSERSATFKFICPMRGCALFSADPDLVGAGPGGGCRPHRGRCPSRLLPMRGAAASGSVASRHREPTIDSCTSGPNRCRRAFIRRDSDPFGTGSVRHCPASDDPSEFVERPSRWD